MGFVGLAGMMFAFQDRTRLAPVVRVLKEAARLGERLMTLLEHLAAPAGPAGPKGASAPDAAPATRPAASHYRETAVLAHIVTDAGRMRPTLVPGQDWTIGRTDAAQIIVGNPLVSAVHCQLFDRGEGWQIVDLNSRNGTYLNGRRVNQAALRDGDRIAFGDPGPQVTFRFG
jgi:hypothetical protein